MSATNTHPERLTRVSLTLYQALLLLYPARFRQRYGAQMAQTFHDSLRAAARRGGLAGVAHVWRVTLGDLLITALAEYLEEDRTMESLALYRTTGMVSLVGVAAWILGSISVTVGLALTHKAGGPPPLAVSLVLPTAWMFFVVSCIGLYTRLAAQRGAVVWGPGVVAIIALLAVMAGALYWTWASQIGVQYSGSATIVDLSARSPVNEQFDYYAYVVSNLGIPAVGLALIVTAWLTRREADLRTVVRTLLVMGIVSAAYYFFTDMGAPSLLRNTGAPGDIGMGAGALAFAAVWLGGWVRLGLWLWRAGAAPVGATTPAHTNTQATAE